LAQLYAVAVHVERGPVGGGENGQQRSEGQARSEGPWSTALAPALVRDAVAAPDSGTHFRAVGFAVSALGHATEQRFRKTLATVELDPRGLFVLQAVDAAAGRSEQAIGDRLRLPHEVTFSVAEELERRSLLERREDPDDPQAHQLYLTAAGRALLERALALVAELELDLCAQLSAPQRTQLLALLDRVGRRLGLPPGADAVHAHPALAEE